jgi:hypothetical protein
MELVTEVSLLWSLGPCMLDISQTGVAYVKNPSNDIFTCVYRLILNLNS